jgi:hypothetical protein
MMMIIIISPFGQLLGLWATCSLGARDVCVYVYVYVSTSMCMRQRLCFHIRSLNMPVIKVESEHALLNDFSKSKHAAWLQND